MSVAVTGAGGEKLGAGESCRSLEPSQVREHDKGQLEKK